MAQVDDLIVFGLTPRAGKRHHVYMVPAGDARRSRRLRRLRIENIAGHVCKTLDTAKERVVSARGFVVAWRDVRQDNTGRVGREWLCVATSSDGCRLQATEKGEKWLKGKLEELGKIVENRGWGDSGPLFEEMQVLSDWESEVRDKRDLFTCVPERDEMVAANAPAQLPDLTGWLPRAAARLWRMLSRIWHGAVRHLNMIIACVSVLLPLVAIFFHIRCNGHSSTRPAEEGADLRALADAVGVDAGRGDVEQAIEDRLSQLFHRKPGDWTETTAVGRIVKMLEDFEKAQGRRSRGEFAALVKSPVLLADLKRVFRGGKFSRTGLLDGEEAEFWQDVAPWQVYALQKAVIAIEADKKWPSGDGAWEVAAEVKTHLAGAKHEKYYKVFEAIREYRVQAGSPGKIDESGSSVERREFYVAGDKDDLKLPAFRKMLKSMCEQVRAERCDTAKKCVEAVVGALGSGGGWDIKRDIEHFGGSGEEEPSRRFARYLEALNLVADEWSKCMRQP